MKKTLGNYVSQYFKMPSLYRDDLEAIEDIVSQALKPKTYHIAFDGFEYDGLADIPADKKATPTFVLYTHRPSLRLKLTRSWAELYAVDAGSDVDGAVRGIAEVITRAQRPYLWALCKYSSWLAPLVGFGSIALAMGLISLNFLSPRALYLVFLCLMGAALWWGVGYRYNLYSFSSIRFSRRTGKIAFWQRHPDKIIVFVLGSALGGVVAILLYKYCHS